MEGKNTTERISKNRQPPRKNISALKGKQIQTETINVDARREEEEIKLETPKEVARLMKI